MVPRRGEIWLANLDPVAGHEQGGIRPCIVVSADQYNSLPIEMAIVVPLTTRDRGLAHQTPIAGAERKIWARPEDVRAISVGRLRRRLGHARPDDLDAIAMTLRAFLDL